MPTNLAIEDRLIEAARKIGHHKTNKEAVIAALSEYISHRKRLQLFSAVRNDRFLILTCDYKVERRKRR